MHEGDELRWHYYNDTHILFNPIFKLTRTEKMDVLNKEMGKLKVNDSKQRMYDAIENWDYSSYGKITQKGVAELSVLSLPTIKRHWADLKPFVLELNNKSFNLQTTCLMLLSNFFCDNTHYLESKFYL